MDGMKRSDGIHETPQKSSPLGYFAVILAVLGGSLLIPPFSLVFTSIGALLLLSAITALLIYKTRRGQQRGMVKILARWRRVPQMHRHGHSLAHRQPQNLLPGAGSGKPV